MFLMFILKHQTGGRSNVIEYDCKIIGSNRLMFGSDYPFGRAWFKNTFNYNDEVDFIIDANISEDDKYNIMHKTILSLIEECDECRKSFYVRPVVFEKYRNNGYHSKILEYFIRLFTDSLVKTHINDERMDFLLSKFGFQKDKERKYLIGQGMTHNAI